MTQLATISMAGTTATLTLNRADKRNALSREMLVDMQARLAELRAMEGVSACVVTGAGAVFCAGMDLKAVLRDREGVRQLLAMIAEATISLRSLPMPTIARVNGAAIGGGCGIVGVCDIAVTHPDAKLGYPEVDLGVCPAVVAPWLVNKIGAGRARRVLLEGGTMTGQRALEMGLVSEVVPAGELDARVASITDRLARAGLEAVRATKRLLNELDGPGLYDAVRRGAELSAEVVSGAEAQARLGRLYG